MKNEYGEEYQVVQALLAVKNCSKKVVSNPRTGTNVIRQSGDAAKQGQQSMFQSLPRGHSK